MFIQNVKSRKISLASFALKFGKIVNFDSMGESLYFASKCFAALLTLEWSNLQVNNFIVSLVQPLQEELLGTIFTLVNIGSVNFVGVIFKLRGGVKVCLTNCAFHLCSVCSQLVLLQ